MRGSGREPRYLHMNDYGMSDTGKWVRPSARGRERKMWAGYAIFGVERCWCLHTIRRRVFQNFFDLLSIFIKTAHIAIIFICIDRRGLQLQAVFFLPRNSNF